VDPAFESVLARVDAELAHAGWKQRLARLLPGLDPSRIDLSIHRGDQMFLHSLVHHGDLGAAASQYFAISMQQLGTLRQILDALHGTARGDLAFLDFACGYGRLLRLLHADVDPSRTWASDIQRDAVDFVVDTFGVHGLVSSAVPEEFAPERQFDAIWVASLFSHLPEGLFQRWLARLAALLSARGTLCFSVRDAALLPAGASLPLAGLLYADVSENAELDASIYGTAYASEAFVARTLAAAAPGCRWVRLPRALANEQDLYVVSRDPDADLQRVARTRRGPWGWVDVRRIDDDGQLDLQGWAASLDDGDVARVEITVDGVRHVLHPAIARADVVAAFEDARMQCSGWALRSAVAASARVDVEVVAVDRAGVSNVLYAGAVTR
jgi:SAM-dependent methyltransferase